MSVIMQWYLLCTKGMVKKYNLGAFISPSPILERCDQDDQTFLAQNYHLGHFLLNIVFGTRVHIWYTIERPEGVTRVVART